MNELLKKFYYILPANYREIIRKLFRRYSYFVGQIMFTVIFPLMQDRRIQDFNAFEQRMYSQNGEDGIIKIILYKIGVTNKFCVEFGVGDGEECNTRYLIEKEGWSYLHMDGNENLKSFSDIKREFITAENINLLFEKYHVPKEFDLLSLDLDYNTYWVWKAIRGYMPRMIVIEYNSSINVDENKVVPYDPAGVWDETQYFGASLLALVNLGNLKGYTLVYCDKKGVNAFFVRKDLLGNHFQIKDIKDIYKPPMYGKKVDGKYGHKPTNKTFITDIL